MNRNTDEYKIAMGKAGFPLRKEMFYFSMRKGTAWYIPFDLKKEVERIIDRHKSCTGSDDPMETEAMTIARTCDYEVRAVKPGNWVMAGDVIFTVWGSSYLISCAEAELIQLHRYIQIATHIEVSCLAYQEYPTITTYGRHDLEVVRRLFPDARLCIDDLDKYRENALESWRKIKIAADGYPIIEAGLRSAPSSHVHSDMILDLAEIGRLRDTSHIEAANVAAINSVGTMGHEHCQRFETDFAAFEAMVTRVPRLTVCLVDTRDTAQGVAAARRLMELHPGRLIGIRYDSGDVAKQLEDFYEITKDHCAQYVLAGGMNPFRVERCAEVAHRLGIPKEKLSFLVGGYLSCTSEFSRDKASAVLKLCYSNRPTCKTSPGKASIPGKPETWMSKDRLQTYTLQHGEYCDYFGNSGNMVNLFEEVRELDENDIIDVTCGRGRSHLSLLTKSFLKNTK